MRHGSSATLIDVSRRYPRLQVPPSRPLVFFHLGLSLAKLLDALPSLPSSSLLFEGGGGRRREQEEKEDAEACTALLRALAQLFEVGREERRRMGGRKINRLPHLTTSINPGLLLLLCSHFSSLPPCLPSSLPPFVSPQEMEYHTASGAVQGVKLLLARPSDSPYPEQTRAGTEGPIPLPLPPSLPPALFPPSRLPSLCDISPFLPPFLLPRFFPQVLMSLSIRGSTALALMLFSRCGGEGGREGEREREGGREGGGEQEGEYMFLLSPIRLSVGG